MWGSGLELHGGKKGVEGGRVALVVEQLECGRNDRSVPTVDGGAVSFPIQNLVHAIQRRESPKELSECMSPSRRNPRDDIFTDYTGARTTFLPVTSYFISSCMILGDSEKS